MRSCGVSLVGGLILLMPIGFHAQDQPHSAQTANSSSSKPVRHAANHAPDSMEAGILSEGAYRNRSLGFSCRIPAGWVLRTEEMNSGDDETDSPQDASKANRDQGLVLLAAFSRPPEAIGDDVNSSILIATESVSAYPGLKEAGQYFGPVEEIAKTKGLAVKKEPYEVAVGSKPLAREDFQRDVGSRVLRQSTLVMLVRGQIVSFTFIGGTEDEVEELIAGLSFVGGTSEKHK